MMLIVILFVVSVYEPLMTLTRLKFRAILDILLNLTIQSRNSANSILLQQEVAAVQLTA